MPVTRDEILDRLGKIQQLPTLPVVMDRLSQALSDPNCNAGHIERILVNDPALSTQILKTVNSPMFAAPGVKIKELKSAVARLGFKEVRNIALSTSVFKMFDGLQSRVFNRSEFWRHCLSTSLAAVELGKRKTDAARYRADELHLAGLIHDVGKIILDAYFSELFEQSISLSMQMKIPLYQAEQAVMEIDHAELGAILAERWNLPELAVAVIRHHHQVDKSPEAFRPVLCVVNMANYIVNTQELGTGGDFTAPAFERSAWEKLNVKPEDIQSVVKAVCEQAGELNHLL